MEYDVRAKGVSDDLIKHGLDLGLKIRINTRFWAEQVGLPFYPTHVKPVNQFERRTAIQTCSNILETTS